jgi:hypothetical protein
MEEWKFWLMEANPSNDVEDRKIGARKGELLYVFTLDCNLYSMTEDLWRVRGSNGSGSKE